MKKLLLIIIPFLIYNSSIACSCMSAGNTLCETFKNDRHITLVTLCRKIDTVVYGFKVERLLNFYGTETRDTLMVWGDNGALCRMYDQWQIGDSMVLSLQNCDTAGNVVINHDYPKVTERTSDYQVSVCGVYSADVVNGKVRGYIDTAYLQFLDISTLAESTCFERTSTGIEEPKNIFTFYPQINSSQLQIAMDIPGSIILNFYDMNGRQIKTVEAYMGVNAISTNEFMAGTYIVAATYNGNVYRRKFVITQ